MFETMKCGTSTFRFYIFEMLYEVNKNQSIFSDVFRKKNIQTFQGREALKLMYAHYE